MPRYNSVSQVFKQGLVQRQRKRGRALKKWSDQIRNDTGLPLLKAEGYAINRAGWEGGTSKCTASGHSSNSVLFK